MDKAELAAKSPLTFILVLLVGALSFTVALSWYDMTKTFVYTYVTKENSFKAISIYALIITTVLIVIAYILTKIYPQVYISV